MTRENTLIGALNLEPTVKVSVICQNHGNLGQVLANQVQEIVEAHEVNEMCVSTIEVQVVPPNAN